MFFRFLPNASFLVVSPPARREMKRLTARSFFVIPSYSISRIICQVSIYLNNIILLILAKI